MKIQISSLFLLICLCLPYSLCAQNEPLSISDISPELLINANAVLRTEQLRTVIEDIDKMTVYKTRIVTVLNKSGDGLVGAGQFYDNTTRIKRQQAVIYNAQGKEIRKYKQKEFTDASAVSSNDLFNDNRIKYLDYTPQQYPYTVVYESEVIYGTTVFVRPWEPLSNYYLSVEHSAYSLDNPRTIPYRIQERAMDDLKVEKSSSPTGFTYNITNMPAIKKESLSPSLGDVTPRLLVALNEFSLVGVTGKATSWSEFGSWQFHNLLEGRSQLPQATLDKIALLTKDARNDIEKAELIYQYVQDNTRYISVQLGIGGWMPMTASDVDRLGYGDCKALTNYTMALLKSQNIASYYAVVFAGEEKRDISEDFASMQGNHVILNIPQEKEDIWLECTSQTHPFNYLGDFTDNRNVLLIKPEGGEIVKTTSYSPAENLRETYSRVQLDENGGFSAELKRTSHGVAYGNIYHLVRQTQENKDLYYKNIFSHLQNLQIEKIDHDNDRKNKAFTEEVIFKGEKLTTRAGKNFLLPVNFLLASTYTLPRSQDRKLPLEIERGFTYRDTFVYILPSGFTAESLPAQEAFKNEFGSFQVKVVAREDQGNNLIEVVRDYTVNEGLWPADSYGEFRDFMNRINAMNKHKAVIVSNI